MIKRFLLAATMGTALLATGAVHADELTATKRAQIKSLLDLTGVQNIPEQIATNTVQSWAPGIRQIDPKFPDKGFVLMRDAFRDVLKAKVDTAGGLTEQVTLVYHNNLSASEVAEIVKFYQSPAGKKLLNAQGKINGETMQAAMKWADSLTEEIDQRMEEALKKEGLKMPDPNAAPAAPAAPAPAPKKK